MPHINILDKDTINKIAAGEVVERPSSVVKELSENSIDAGATAISVTISHGGTSLIRITDNGCGIAREDIEIAFLKNTTSKIMNAEDLDHVESLGFRGEALSSIAGVAKVELMTKTKNDLNGIRYCIEGGEKGIISEIGSPEGTTIVVRDLFFNTPVRRKFLKSDMTEAGYVNDVMERIALARPDISVKFTNNDKIIISTSGNGNIKEVIYSLYGREIAAQVIDVSFSLCDMAVTGMIARPVISRGNRNFENYFLNGRYIRNSIINKAIEEAYRTHLMQNKYPFTVLNLLIPVQMYDVNVHPAKLEVRFTHPEQIYEFVYQAVSKALHEQNYIPEVTIGETQKEKTTMVKITSAPEPFEQNRVQNNKLHEETLLLAESPMYQSVSNAKNEENPISEITSLTERINEPEAETNNRKDTAKKEAENNTARIKEEFKQESFLTEEAMKDHRIIGQVFSTYWLIEYDDKLYIIDQHAAHERVLYEKIMKSIKEHKPSSQRIIPPMVLTLNLHEIEVLKQSEEYLSELGYEFEPFGGREYLVSAVPAELEAIGKQNLLMEFIDEMCRDTIHGESELLYEKIASMSCKAAVKGNCRLSAEEAECLIEQLLNLENPFRCPHGRPVMIEITKQEMEKKFKRIL